MATDPQSEPRANRKMRNANTKARRLFERHRERLMEYLRQCDYDSLEAISRRDHGLATWLAKMRSRLRDNTLPSDFDRGLRAVREQLCADRSDPVSETEFRLQTLRRFRLTNPGGIPTRHDRDPEHAAFAAWLHRQRRRAVGGTLDAATIAALRAEQIDVLAVEYNRQSAGVTLEEAAFDRNLAILSAYLEAVAAETGQRNLRYRDCDGSPACRLSYRFVEHLRAKQRIGLLSHTHRGKILELNFHLNDKPIGDYLRKVIL